MRESTFEKNIIKEIRDMFPGCIIQKGDSSQIQGIPDRLILFRDRWAVLEFKKSATAKERPNQRHYVEQMNSMSFAAFIYPENAEEVLNELQFAFETGRAALIT